LRRKIGCTRKEIGVYLASASIHVRGVVDEVLHFADGSVSPLDYKLTEYKDFLFKTHKIQSTLYAMLIEEIYEKEVKRGFICYAKGGLKLVEVDYKTSDFDRARELLSGIFRIVERGYFPKRNRWRNRCIDCCYRNICV